MRVFAGNVGIRLRTALFAVLLAVPPLVAGAPAPAANAGIAGPIQPFPWDSRPKGWIAFGSEGGTDARGQPITGGLFAATRECSSLDCTYRLTDNPADHDPAWDPTGQFVWFATQACRNDGLCTSTIGSVDTATGAVSRFDPFAIDAFTGKEGVATWSPAPSYDGTRVAVTMAVAGGGIFSSIRTVSVRTGGVGIGGGGTQIGVTSGFGMEQLSTGGNSRDTCGGAVAGRRAPRWNPVADQLAFIRSDNCGIRVFVADASDINGTERHIPTPIDYVDPGFVPDQTWGPTGVDWSPDGTKLVVSGLDANRECRSFVIRLDGGGVESETELLGRLGCYGDDHPRWSPDGKLIALVDRLVEPDGSGVITCGDQGYPCFVSPLDGPNHDEHGSSADPQCTPGTCLTLILVHKLTEDFSAQRYPATFTFNAKFDDGSARGQVTLTGDPFLRPFDRSTIASLRVKPGRVIVSEDPAPGWVPSRIECKREGAAANVVDGVVVLTVPEGSITDCFFTNDPGDFPLPESTETFPVGSPSPMPTCILPRTYESEWRAYIFTFSTLRLHVRIPWCKAGGKAILTGDIEVTPDIGPYYIPALFSPYTFQLKKGSIFTTPRRLGDDLVVEIQADFEVCTNIVQVLTIVAPELRALKLARLLPKKLQRELIDRLLWTFDTMLERAIQGVVGPLSAPERQLALDLFKESWRPSRNVLARALEEVIVNAAVNELLDSPARLALFGPIASHDFCSLTWQPRFTIGISPDDPPIVTDHGEPPSVWDVRQLGINGAP